MRIESVSATPVCLPLAKALNLLGGSAPSFTNVLVRVRTTDGVLGYAEATPRPRLNGETVHSVTGLIDSVVAPLLSGREVHGYRGVTAALKVIVGNPCAKAAVEAAALDAFARGLGISCHALLGGYTESIACSGLLPLGEPAAVVSRAAEMHTRHGITAFKLKVGADLQRDSATARLLRHEFPEAILLADANGGYSPADALAFLRTAEAEGLTMVEEPTSCADMRVRRRLTESTPVDTVGDESCTTTSQAIEAITSGTMRGVSIKVGRTGLTDSALIRDTADRLGARVQIGYETVSSVGSAISLAFAASSPSSSCHPSEGISFLELAQDVVSAPLEIKDGRIQVTPAPGFGFDIDDDLVRSLTAT